MSPEPSKVPPPVREPLRSLVERSRIEQGYHGGVPAEPAPSQDLPQPGSGPPPPPGFADKLAAEARVLERGDALRNPALFSVGPPPVASGPSAVEEALRAQEAAHRARLAAAQRTKP